jgi:glycosyltransferase involved in cell wall biosynthesis
VTPSPLVSIILPTYNGSRYLGEAVRSVLRQTYSNWELLIVDDASTDETPALIERYVTQDRRIHSTRHPSNRKLPAALNTGFSIARGEYLTWTSDDNSYRPEALSEMMEFLKTNPSADVVYADYSPIDENGEVSGRVTLGNPETLSMCNCVGPCFLFRRGVW